MYRAGVDFVSQYLLYIHLTFIEVKYKHKQIQIQIQKNCNTGNLGKKRTSDKYFNMTSTNVPVEEGSVLVPIADVDSIILLKGLFRINRTFVKMLPHVPFKGLIQKGKAIMLEYI